MTDGCSTMTKLGRLAEPVFQQLCYAHALQLTVLDVLYAKKNQTNQTETGANDLGSHVNSDSDSADEDLYQDLTVHETFNPCEYRDDINLLVKGVRTVVKHFKKSPLANEKLQDNTQKFHGKELTLLLDCKTRWSRLFTMLERFSFLYLCVMKTLGDEGNEGLAKDIDVKFLDQIVDVLRPLEIVTRKICQRDATLITADTIFSIALNKLKDLQTPISIQLYENLLKRLSERRTILSDTLFYLHFAKMERPENSLIEMASRSDITRNIRRLVARLKNEVGNKTIVPISDELLDFDVDEPEAPLAKRAKSKNIEEEMELEFNQAMQGSPKSAKDSSTLHQTIKKEMELFENGGNRGSNLRFVYELLLNVKPTSVESERAFSTSGNFCSKLRTRLADNTLSNICYLKSYFLENIEN